jgi:hypothetical protein
MSAYSNAVYQHSVGLTVCLLCKSDISEKFTTFRHVQQRGSLKSHTDNMPSCLDRYADSGSDRLLAPGIAPSNNRSHFFYQRGSHTAFDVTGA